MFHLHALLCLELAVRFLCLCVGVNGHDLVKAEEKKAIGWDINEYMGNVPLKNSYFNQNYCNTCIHYSIIEVISLKKCSIPSN